MMPYEKLKTYYIAYFDILGYKAFFDDNSTNDIWDFLHSNISLAQDVTDTTTSAEYVAKSFSDNFMILLDAQNGIAEFTAINTLSKLMAVLQLRFLEKYKLLIRGCITKGEVYIDDNIVFGDGLIKAVSLEQDAFFPRIIVNSNVIDKKVCDGLCGAYLSKDEDEKYYVNFFNALRGNDAIISTEKAQFQERYKVIRDNVITLVKKYGKYNRQVKDQRKIEEAEKTISKYAWLLTKFNSFCEDSNCSAIPYKLVLYYRLMRCEISIE